MILQRLNMVSHYAGQRSTPREAQASAKRLVCLTVSLCMVTLCSCIVGHPAGILDVRGVVLDADTLDGAADAALGIETFTDGERTEFQPAIIFNGSPNGPPPAADGSFRMVLSRIQVDPFPRPDRIDIIVVRGGCEQRFTIEINADTVIDPTAPDDILELIDPILVPPCEPSP